MSNLGTGLLLLASLLASLGPGSFTGSSNVPPRDVPMVVADSVRDFSGSQGTNGWFYGYWNRSTDQDGVYDQERDFRRLRRFGTDRVNGLRQHTAFTTGDLWYLEDGRYYTSLWATGGHPHGTMDLNAHARAEHWVVRRWISSVSDDVEIRGFGGKVMPWGENWRGDFKLLIVVGGSRVYEAVLGDRGESYSVNARLQAGTVVDFLIGPGSAIGVIEFTGVIRAKRRARE